MIPTKMRIYRGIKSMEIFARQGSFCCQGNYLVKGLAVEKRRSRMGNEIEVGPVNVVKCDFSYTKP